MALVRIVVLQCVRVSEVFCGLHVAHVRIICPVCDVNHVKKCTRSSPTLPYCKRLGSWAGGLGMRLAIYHAITRNEVRGFFIHILSDSNRGWFRISPLLRLHDYDIMTIVELFIMYAPALFLTMHHVMH